MKMDRFQSLAYQQTHGTPAPPPAEPPPAFEFIAAPCPLCGHADCGHFIGTDADEGKPEKDRRKVYFRTVDNVMDFIALTDEQLDRARID